MFFNYQNNKIYYEVVGVGPSIIFLHGWGSSSQNFLNIIDDLIAKYKVILIDLPSFGNSPSFQNPPSIKDLHNLLDAFIKELNIEKPIIVGHSYGGRIAIEYASKNKNISSLILIDSAGIKNNIIKNKLKVLIYKLKKRYYKLTKNYMKYQNLITSSGSSDFKNASLIQKQMLIKAVNYNQKKLLKKIKCPTLIIFGENDLTVPLKDAYIFNKKIKNSGLVIIPNATHFPHIENEYYFKKVINTYLEV